MHTQRKDVVLTETIEATLTTATTEQITETQNALPTEASAAQNSTEKYIFRDEHWVGADNFVVPNCYREFQEQFPNHIRSFVDRHMLGRSIADREDRASELHLFLMTLPDGSKFREAGVNGFTTGCVDRVQTFHPERAHGASKPRFLNFINHMLLNAFISLLKKTSSNPIERVNNLAYFQGDSDSPSVINDEYLHEMVSDSFLQSTYASRVMEDNIVMMEARTFIERHNPELMVVFNTIAMCETFVEAQQMLGMDEQLFTRARNRLQRLMACFEKGVLPPRQRKVYRPRASKTAKLADGVQELAYA